MRHHFKHAIDLLDASEEPVRNAIENGLFDVTGPNSTKKNAVKKSVDAVMAEITRHRTKAMKDAFRHLRANLPHV